MVRDDLKFALRALRHDTLYAATVIGTLAITLGASTAVFSIVNGVLLQPLPYPQPGRLVLIREIVPRLAAQDPTLPANLRHVEEWRNHATAFASIAALDWRTANVTGAGDPFQASILRASGTLYAVLQAPVAVGRPLARTDEGPAAPPVVVITDELWRDRFGHDQGILGRSLTIGGTQYTIVGVLPPRFSIPAFQVLEQSATLRSRFAAIVPFRLNVANIGWMGQYNYPVLARLNPRETLEHARAELEVLQRVVAATAQREAHDAMDLLGDLTPLDEAIVGRARTGLLSLLGTIVGVVLIACANLANLSLTRTVGRLRDAAVRSALGANRARLLRPLLLEQLVLAAAGGAIGLVLAAQALRLFVRTAPIDLPRATDVMIDGRVLGFAAAMTIAAGLAVALLPAWRLGRGDVQTVLRAGGHGSSDYSSMHARELLLGVQVALSVTLLVVTGLFVASFVRLVAVDPGFSTAQVVTVEIAPVAARYPDATVRAALYDRIADRARRLPAIASVTWTSALPLTGETWVSGLVRVGDSRPETQRPNANYRFIGPDYFRILSMPILKGRSIVERDRSNAVTPAVLSARAAKTLWLEADPIGQTFTHNGSQTFEVVGVVVDGHPTALETESPLMVYVPYWFNNEGKSILIARTTTTEVETAIRTLGDAVHAVDPEIAIGDASPLRTVVDTALQARRYQTTLFVAFGIVALVIAMTGVYATTAYGVSRRRREINIRVALGARTSQMFALVLRQAAAPLLAGVTIGCAGALAVGTVVAGLLFQVRPHDPAVMLTAALLISVSGLLAAATAARRGLRTNPVEALRQE